MKKRSTENLTTLQSILAGALLLLLIYLGVTFAVSLISYGTSDPTSLIDPLSLTALLISGAVGSLVITRLSSDKSVPVALLSSLLVALVLLVVGLIASGGALPLRCPINYLCYVGISALVSLLAKRRKERRHKRR